MLRCSSILCIGIAVCWCANRAHSRGNETSVRLTVGHVALVRTRSAICMILYIKSDKKDEPICKMGSLAELDETGEKMESLSPENETGDDILRISDGEDAELSRPSALSLPLADLKLTSITDSLQQNQQKFFYDTPSIFRRVVRYGSFTSTTLNICPGYLQCNLVVLRKGSIAFDFLLFCQRNPKTCPLIEVCDTKAMHPPKILAHDDADLRTDIPKYCIYRNGKLSHIVNNVMDFWPEDSIAFLLGCSFTFDFELMQAGIRLKYIEEGLNMPMYQTNIPCRSAGALSGNMVVSMRPILASQLPKVVEITSKYPHAHGAPVCIGGDPANIGILDLSKPDWGDPIEIDDDEIPVFHASGVSLQNLLLHAGADFSITNYPGYNFVTDLPANGRDYLEHRT